MSGHQEAAVLPWGSGQQPDEPNVEKDYPAAQGLALGAELDVLWQLHIAQEGADEDRVEMKWWGARLEQRLEGQTDGEGRQVYLLSYEPDADNGWEEREERRVTFLGPHELYDLSEDALDLLHWRRAGEAWEPQAEVLAEGGLVSLQQIAAEISAAERRRGRSVEEEAAEALQELPPEQRSFVAAGFRSFADAMTAELARLTAQHGEGYVITEADMRTATAAAMQAALRGAS